MSGMSSDICRSTCKLDLSGFGTWKKFSFFGNISRLFGGRYLLLFLNIEGHKLLSNKIHDYFNTKLIHIQRTASSRLMKELFLMRSFLKMEQHRRNTFVSKYSTILL